MKANLGICFREISDLCGGSRKRNLGTGAFVLNMVLVSRPHFFPSRVGTTSNSVTFLYRTGLRIVKEKKSSIVATYSPQGMSSTTVSKVPVCTTFSWNVYAPLTVHHISSSTVPEARCAKFRDLSVQLGTRRTSTPKDPPFQIRCTMTPIGPTFPPASAFCPRAVAYCQREAGELARYSSHPCRTCGESGLRRLDYV